MRSGYLQPKPASTSFSAASAQSDRRAGTGPKVLLLSDADGAATTALGTSLANAGFQVTVRPAPEFSWDGTNPALTGYALVIHLNGVTWSNPLRPGRSDGAHQLRPEWRWLYCCQWNGYEARSGGTQRGCRSSCFRGPEPAVGSASSLITWFKVRRATRCSPGFLRPSTSALTATTRGRSSLCDQPVYGADASAERPSRRTGAPVRIG